MAELFNVQIFESRKFGFRLSATKFQTTVTIEQSLGLLTKPVKIRIDRT